MRTLLWLPFIVVVGVVASGTAVFAGGDVYKNGKTAFLGGSGPSSVNSGKVGSMVPGRAELNDRDYPKRRACYVSPRSLRTTFPGAGWCGRGR